MFLEILSGFFKQFLLLHMILVLFADSKCNVLSGTISLCLIHKVLLACVV